MIKIHYTSHLELRLSIRKIPFDYPRRIYQNPDQRFMDVLENKEIAIKKLMYNRKLRNMMVAYETKAEFIEIITIHPITDEKIINRAMSGRWLRK